MYKIRWIFGFAFFGFALGLVVFMGQHADGVKTTEEFLGIAGIIAAAFASLPLVFFLIAAFLSTAFTSNSNETTTGKAGYSDSHGGGYTSGGTSGGGDCGGGGGDC